MDDPRLMSEDLLLDQIEMRCATTVMGHIDALQAALERWQDHAYRATERADALSKQRADLQAIIGRQEEELEQARFREVALERAIRQLYSVMTDDNRGGVVTEQELTDMATWLKEVLG